MSNKVDCYLSSSVDSYHAIILLHNQFSSNLYSFNFRNNQSEFSIKDSETIKNSKIFIAFITSGYLNSYIGITEFENAKYLKKPKLCLFLPDLNTIEKLSYKTFIPKEVIINSMRQSFCLNLANYDFDGNRWSIDTLMRINTHLDEMIRRYDLFDEGVLMKESKINALTLPSIPNFRSLNFDKIQIESGLLLFRSTLISSSKLAIIVFEILSKKYFVDIYDLSDRRLFRRLSHLKNPSLITSNSKLEMLITDTSNGTLYIYRHDLVSIRLQVKLKLYDYNDMSFDDEKNDIYFVKCIGNCEITIYMCNQNRIKKIDKSWFTNNSFRPKSIKVNKDKLYILNACSVRIDQDNGEIIEKTFGDSLIYILNKITFDIQKIIDFNNEYSQPWSLVIDNELNIYTTLYKINKENHVEITERYLCKLERNTGIILDNCIHKLNTKYLQNDLFYTNNTFYFVTENGINKYSIIS